LSAEPAILVREVTKTYAGGFQAVQGVSFEVQHGEFFGLLGPNGAGKSSLMRMLYNKSTRTSGHIEVLGFDPLRNELEIKYLSGIVPQDDNLDVDLDVVTNLRVYARFYGLSAKATRARIDELLDFLELGEKKKAKIRELSGGMRRRLIIARALLNEPKLLILDEPTTGLDPQVRHLIWDKLRLLKKQGLTLMLTTHYMEEAFQLCDRLAILDRGLTVLEGRPIDLVKSHIEAYVLEIIQREASAALTYTGPVRRETIQDRVLFFSNSAAELEAIARGLNPGDFYLRQSNLEDVFLKTTGRSLHE
jgi:lipooligosaccharide transport system ATP-binding protein